VLGGAILVSGSLIGRDQFTLGGGEAIVLGSNVMWTLYSIKAQAWFDRASQLHRTYVASLSAMGWSILASVLLIALGWSRSPFEVADGWAWTQLLAIALFASGLGGYFWNIGASRLGVAVASLWVNLVPFFAVLWSMAYGFVPNVWQITGGLVALSGVVYMQWRKLSTMPRP
jgi:drug/metabolite transporter (DMT)-like permease